MEPLEEGQSIVVLTTSESTSYVVGTTYVKPDESEPTSGRLLVFAQKEGRTFEQTNSIAIAGSPYALASLSDNHVAAAINSVVSRNQSRLSNSKLIFFFFFFRSLRSKFSQSILFRIY